MATSTSDLVKTSFTKKLLSFSLAPVILLTSINPASSHCYREREATAGLTFGILKGFGIRESIIFKDYLDCL